MTLAEVGTNRWSSAISQYFATDRESPLAAKIMVYSRFESVRGGLFESATRRRHEGPVWRRVRRRIVLCIWVLEGRFRGRERSCSLYRRQHRSSRPSASCCVYGVVSWNGVKAEGGAKRSIIIVDLCPGVLFGVAEIARSNDL